MPRQGPPWTFALPRCEVIDFVMIIRGFPSWDTGTKVDVLEDRFGLTGHNQHLTPQHYAAGWDRYRQADPFDGERRPVSAMTNL
jgi:hypothetical protein